MDSLHGFWVNITDTAEGNEGAHPDQQAWNYIQSTLLFTSQVTSNEFSDFFGNCTITAIDVVHTFWWYIDSYSQGTFVQLIESWSFSLMDRATEFRSNFMYLEYYDNQQLINIPGIATIMINFVWSIFWFDNLYYGNNPVLD